MHGMGEVPNGTFVRAKQYVTVAIDLVLWLAPGFLRSGGPPGGLTSMQLLHVEHSGIPVENRW